jgi:D-3-phosphoglycerate dehydrogenase / 2-oxoglutarate reductase
MLVTFHKDEPGVVGKLGTLLGDAGCNISRMQIGSNKDSSKQEQGMALGVLNLDGNVHDDLIAKVLTIDAIVHARLVR